MARKNPVTEFVGLDERRELANTEVTLNGRRAVICGVQNQFATVATIPNGPAFEWAWPAVRRIVKEKGGAFKN
jgi:hypothetical protein